jgi:hypothetical protein
MLTIIYSSRPTIRIVNVMKKPHTSVKNPVKHLRPHARPTKLSGWFTRNLPDVLAKKPKPIRT